MNLNHLKEMINLLESIPEVDFDLSTWRFDPNNPENEENPDKYPKVNDPNNCGFVACAIGWACATPYFNEHGLNYDPTMCRPTYIDLDSFAAVIHFFGFESPKTAYALFFDENYRTKQNTKPAEVADRIRELISLGEPAFFSKYLTARSI